MLIANGIFMWSGTERRSKRYGLVYPARQDADCTVVAPNYRVMEESLRLWVDKKVKITCKVVEARDSRHLGDMFVLDENDEYIKPSQPAVGEEIVVGVGTFFLGESSDGETAFGLLPEEPREHFWMDPRILYRLHEQTVNFYVEQTDEPFTPLTTLRLDERQGAISSGDGYCQVNESAGKLIENGKNFTLRPKIEKIGDGLFKVTPPNAPGNKGEFFEVVKKIHGE